LIGFVFLIIVVASPDGLIGLWRRLRGEAPGLGGVVVVPRP
jgi:hypothetical protein